MLVPDMYGAFTTLSFTDSPVSLGYRQDESTIFSPLYLPVHIPIEVIAYPRTVNFQWYFNESGKGWVSLNASDDRFSITEQGMNSTLTINKLYLNLTGDYRVETSNGIKSTKVYRFTVLPEGTVLLRFYTSYISENQLVEMFVICNICQFEIFNTFPNLNYYLAMQPRIGILLEGVSSRSHPRLGFDKKYLIIY